LIVSFDDQELALINQAALLSNLAAERRPAALTHREGIYADGTIFRVQGIMPGKKMCDRFAC
jgi:hypothetical protein